MHIIKHIYPKIPPDVFKITSSTSQEPSLDTSCVNSTVIEHKRHDKEHFSELFTPDFFDLIIVDECHRGSAKEESRWRRILEYFSSSTQIGMTATPKETKYISNLSYFGEPVYMYSLFKSS